MSGVKLPSGEARVIPFFCCTSVLRVQKKTKNSRIGLAKESGGPGVSRTRPQNRTGLCERWRKRDDCGDTVVFSRRREWPSPP